MAVGVEFEGKTTGKRIDEIRTQTSVPLTDEFFARMIELVGPVAETGEGAVAPVFARIEQLLADGAELSQFATLATASPTFDPRDLTGQTTYYQWVIERVRAMGYDPISLFHVSWHFTFCHDRFEDEDLLIHAANWLRRMSWLYIMLFANSPFRDGKPAGVLSRRMLEFPNRYDVPLWWGAKRCRKWHWEEVEAGRLHIKKPRPWMTVCPRFNGDDIDRYMRRIEVRSADGGLGVPQELVEAGCELGMRLIEMAFDRKRTSVTARLDEIEANDRNVAMRGREAMITWGGSQYRAADFAREFCQGIPALEQVLEDGSPAELALRRGAPPKGH